MGRNAGIIRLAATLIKFKKTPLVVSLLVLLLVPLLRLGVAAAAPTITEYPIPAPYGMGGGIASGPDGNLWFTEVLGKRIGKTSTNGTMTMYSLPSSPYNYFPGSVTAGPDGAMWVAMSASGSNDPAVVGHMATNGTFTEYPLNPQYTGGTTNLTVGSDGALWFGERNINGTAIGRMTTSGQVTDYPLPANVEPYAITSGADGNLWFTDPINNTINSMTTDGTLTQYQLPNVDPAYLTAGPDGNVWFGEDSGGTTGAGAIASITPSGQITTYSLPAGSAPNGITVGSDGALWFASGSGSNGSIGRMTTSGVVFVYPVATSQAWPGFITTGPDGNLWFTELGNKRSSSAANNIGEVNIAPAPSAPTNLSASSPTNQSPALSWTAASGATSYNIYRNGTDIGNTTSTTYTDTSLTSDGTYSYAVTAVNVAGESSQSNTVSVIYDTTPPVVTLTGAINGQTYTANNAPTPVCNTTDALSGVATDAVLTMLNSGYSYTATCAGATDNAGNSAGSVSATYNVLPANYTLVNLADSNGNPLTNAKITIENAQSNITTLSTDNFGNAFANTAPGTYKVTVYYANGYESQTVTVTANGPNTVSFSTVPVTVTINDPDATGLANATVAQAGNTGTFGAKQAVDSNGQITFQVLPGTNYFTAYVAGGHEEQSIAASSTNNTVTFTTDAVTVTVTKNGNPLTTTVVTQAGNSGSFGAKQPVNSDGQYVFYVLPGNNTFEAFDGTYVTKESLDVTEDTDTTIAVQ